jgi:hypothetical protein
MSFSCYTFALAYEKKAYFLANMSSQMYVYKCTKVSRCGGVAKGNHGDQYISPDTYSFGRNYCASTTRRRHRKRPLIPSPSPCMALDIPNENVQHFPDPNDHPKKAGEESCNNREISADGTMRKSHIRLTRNKRKDEISVVEAGIG